jgi:hypothetical protein
VKRGDQGRSAVRQVALVPRTGRVICALVLAMAALAGSSPTAYGRDSTFTITMTLRGDVAPDVGFSLAVGGIFYAPFCVSKAEQESFVEDNPGYKVDPICRSGTTYMLKVPVGAGESVAYEIGIYRPRTGRWLWSGTLSGDGRNHRLSYTYLFDLPATDTLATSATGSGHPSTGWSSVVPVPVLVLVLVLVLEILVSAWWTKALLTHRRGSAHAERGRVGWDGW